mgnify:FL=1
MPLARVLIVHVLNPPLTLCLSPGKKRAIVSNRAELDARGDTDLRHNVLLTIGEDQKEKCESNQKIEFPRLLAQTTTNHHKSPQITTNHR